MKRFIVTSSVLLGATAAILHRVYGDEETHNASQMIEPCRRRFPHFLQNDEGLWLYTARWVVAKPCAIVILVHGLGEYSGRYEHVARALNAANISVYAIDLQVEL